MLFNSFQQNNEKNLSCLIHVYILKAVKILNLEKIVKKQGLSYFNLFKISTTSR